MSGYRFQAMPELRPPSAWRAIDLALARWTLVHGGDLLLAHAAGWAAHADGLGLTALPLSGAVAAEAGLPEWSPAEIAAVRSSALVAEIGSEDEDGSDGTSSSTPFVHREGLFYLRRNYRQETELVRRVCRRLADAEPQPLDEAVLDDLFHGDHDPRLSMQRQAVREAPGRALFVLTGGPGTGKTTTVLRMLLGMLHGAEAGTTVRLAAPTGKAAQRLAQAIRQGKQALIAHPTRPLSSDWWPLLDRIPDDAPSTLHRLLGASARGNRFRHRASAPLAADIVVVDEASMLDVGLLAGLLDALPDAARLILVGDPDQLTPVGGGSALIDLVAALGRRQSGDRVELRHGFRADDALQPLLAAVRDGDGAAFAAAWTAAGDRLGLHALEDARSLAVSLDRWADALHGHWRSVGLLAPLDRSDPAGAAVERLAMARERQLLCVLREGEFGAPACHARIEARLLARIGRREGSPWFPGRQVMISRNDYGVGLFNGDVGLCLADAEGRLGVWFEGSGTAPARCFPPDLLPSHEGAFATTVHKSQGSEYRHVGLVLPSGEAGPALSRQMLYTAFSRARRSIDVFGTPEHLHTALARTLPGHGALARRIVARLAG